MSTHEESPAMGNDRSSILQWFAKHPFVGLIGTVASVVGVILAIIFYIAARAAPDLVYLVHHPRTVLALGDRPSGLSVSWGEERIDDAPVVAAQMSIWNAGDLPIRTEQILAPMIVEASPPVTILEATVVRSTRDLTGFRVLNKATDSSDRVRLTWNILEGRDGAALQIVYAGSPDAELTLAGAVEGQRLPRELRARRAADGQATESNAYPTILAAGLVGWGLGWLVVAYRLAGYRLPFLTLHVRGRRSVNVYLVLGTSLMLIGIASIIYEILSYTEPPF